MYLHLHFKAFLINFDGIEETDEWQGFPIFMIILDLRVATLNTLRDYHVT